jgi:hypothetical protein
LDNFSEGEIRTMEAVEPPIPKEKQRINRLFLALIPLIKEGQAFKKKCYSAKRENMISF